MYLLKHNQGNEMKDYQYTDDTGREWTVKTYKQIRKYSAKSDAGQTVTAGTFKKLMQKMESA